MFTQVIGVKYPLLQIVYCLDQLKRKFYLTLENNLKKVFFLDFFLKTSFEVLNLLDASEYSSSNLHSKSSEGEPDSSLKILK